MRVVPRGCIPHPEVRKPGRVATKWIHGQIFQETGMTDASGSPLSIKELKSLIKETNLIPGAKTPARGSKIPGVTPPF